MRKTIADLTHGVYDYSGHANLADRRARRYHPFSFDFDSTPLSLNAPDEHWDEQVKHLHLENRAREIKRLEQEYGWPFAISVLSDWRVLVDDAGAEFLALGEIRNRSVHFNPETYQSLREDAVVALQRLNAIIAKQFGYFGFQPWFIEDTPSAQFVKRAYENDPFVRVYIIPRSGFVGLLYGMEISREGYWYHLDYADYGDEELSDAEFAKGFGNETPRKSSPVR